MMRSLIRTDTSSGWMSNNPVLGLGEMGFDHTNSILKIGDGVHKWLALEPISFKSSSAGGGSMINISQIESGMYSPSSDTSVSNFSLDVGFKPKIFVIRTASGVPFATSSSKYYITTAVVLADDNYSEISTDSFVSPFVCFTATSTAGGSNNSNNVLAITDTGVHGKSQDVSGSSYTSVCYFAASQKYQWIALG